MLPLFAAAWAADDEKTTVSTSFTDDLEIRYWQLDARQPDNPDRPVFDYVEQVNRLNADVAVNDYTFAVQLDEVALLANRHFLNDQLVIERQLVAGDTFTAFPDDADVFVNLEKVFLKRQRKGMTVQIGDFYGAFARGIALNLNRNVDIDIDTSIQGAKAVFRPGAWDVTVLAGQLNRQQVFQDNPNIQLAGDFRHAVGGVRVERFGLGPANVGAHVVGYDFVLEPGLGAGFDELGTQPDAIVYGASTELIGVAGVDWYAELDGFSHPTDVTFGGERQAPGYAAYVSGATYGTDTVWLVEAKRYYNAERINRILAPELYEVAIAPTLEYERAITEDSSAAVNSNDIWGLRGRMDWTPQTGVVPYVSMAVFRDLELGGLHFNRFPETILHPVVGIEWIQGHSAVLLNAGYRVDDRDYFTPDDTDRQLHADVSIRFPIAGGFYGDLALAGERFRWGRNPLQQQDYVESENAFSVSKGQLTVTTYGDYSDNPLISSIGNVSRRVYTAGEVQWKPSGAFTIKGFYGAQKAGIRCSGGQCRLLPGFEGARMSVVGTF